MHSARIDLYDLLVHLDSRLTCLESGPSRCERARGCGLGATFEVLDDEGNAITQDEFEAKQKAAPQVVLPGKRYTIPRDYLALMIARGDRYWSLLLGSEVHFRLTEEDMAYTTAADTALFRNEYLKSMFLRPPVVVDVFSGAGMDTISFLENLYFKKDIGVKYVYAVENEDNPSRNLRLFHNVFEYIRAKEGIPYDAPIPTSGGSLGGRIEFYPNGAERFFQNCKFFKKNPVDSIDLLYIDPPWMVPGGRNSGKFGEATCEELLDFLYRTIFVHLQEHDIRVKVACIKTRYTWEECQPIIGLLREHMRRDVDEFTHTATIRNQPFRNVYYFHVIRSREADAYDWIPSDLYKTAYNTWKKGGGRRESSHHVVQYTERGDRVIVDTEKDESGGMDFERGVPEITERGKTYKPSRDSAVPGMPRRRPPRSFRS
jgi:hypothetical protein